jgi:hypothetical protein
MGLHEPMKKNMTLKKYYFNKGIKLCLTCKFIDEYAWNAKDDGKVPYGYDGTAECGLFNWDEEETSENRWDIHPLWKPCSKYEKCTKRQADYLEIFDIETQSIIPNPNDISKIKNE